MMSTKNRITAALLLLSALLTACSSDDELSVGQLSSLTGQPISIQASTPRTRVAYTDNLSTNMEHLTGGAMKWNKNDTIFVSSSQAYNYENYPQFGRYVTKTGGTGTITFDTLNAGNALRWGPFDDDKVIRYDKTYYFYAVYPASKVEYTNAAGTAPTSVRLNFPAAQTHQTTTDARDSINNQLLWGHDTLTLTTSDGAYDKVPTLMFKSLVTMLDVVFTFKGLVPDSFTLMFSAQVLDGDVARVIAGDDFTLSMHEGTLTAPASGGSNVVGWSEPVVKATSGLLGMLLTDDIQPETGHLSLYYRVSYKDSSNQDVSKTFHSRLTPKTTIPKGSIIPLTFEYNSGLGIATTLVVEDWVVETIEQDWTDGND